MVIKALEVTARDDGWASLSALGSQLTRNHPSFDSRNYNESKLGELMRKQIYLEMKEVAVGDGPGQVQLYVRRKTATVAMAAKLAYEAISGWPRSRPEPVPFASSVHQYATGRPTRQ